MPWGRHGVSWRLPRRLSWYHQWHAGYPPRRAIKTYAMPWDAVGMPWYAMGGTMAMPRQKSNSVEPWCVGRVHALLSVDRDAEITRAHVENSTHTMR